MMIMCEHKHEEFKHSPVPCKVRNKKELNAQNNYFHVKIGFKILTTIVTKTAFNKNPLNQNSHKGGLVLV